MDCTLCQPLTDDEVWSSDHWRVIVNRQQDTLGKCFLALKRHDEDVCNLTDDEVADLWATIRSVRDVLLARFRPDHFNYAFLMNQDPHVHLHVIPRYKTPREFAGNEFTDRDGAGSGTLPPHIHAEIVTAIREGFTGNYI